MGIKLKNPIISAFFAALGPFFNKQATLDEDSKVFTFFKEHGVKWAIYPFDVICLILMLWSNTIAVKYKMLSYKYDGAFMGTSLIFILGYLFSAMFDFIYSGKFLTLKQTGGALMMILGIVLISFQEEISSVRKRTNSIFALIGNIDFKNFENEEVETKEESTDLGYPFVEGDEPVSGNSETKDLKEADYKENSNTEESMYLNPPLKVSDNTAPLPASENK